MKRVLILEVRRKSVCCFEDDFDVAKRQYVFKRFDQIIQYQISLSKVASMKGSIIDTSIFSTVCTGTYLSFVLLKKFKMHLGHSH